MAFHSHVLAELAIVMSIINTISGFGDVAQSNREKFANFDKHGNVRRAWLASYKNAKEKCSWVDDVDVLEYKYDWFPTDDAMRNSYWRYMISQFRITTYYPEVAGWLLDFMRYLLGAPSPDVTRPTLTSQRCHVVGDNSHEFVIRRLGPFVGTGGFDWHKIKLEDPYNLRSSLRGEGASATGFTAMPVDSHGQILGNPPIHIHHANLGPNHNRSSLARISQWHGDSQCAASDGGTACYVTVLPDGFGFPVNQELSLDIDFNDVRPAQAPEMHFWLETAIQIASPSKQKLTHDVGTVILGVPFRMHWWKSSDFQRLYFVPADRPSALWVTARMPTSGSFVAGKLETHQHMFDVAWVFRRTSPEDLGLNSEGWQLQKPWLPWVPSENGWSNGTAAMLALKFQIRRRFEDVTQRCAEQLSCTKPPALVWTLNRTVFENGEDREMPWPTGAWNFEEGEQFTIVIFHKAMAHTAMHGHKVAPKELPQHLAITGHYLPKVGTHANYYFVLPSTKPEWAWINHVNWFYALTQFGGAPDCSLSLFGAAIIFIWLVATCGSAWCVTTISRRAVLPFLVRMSFCSSTLELAKAHCCRARQAYAKAELDEDEADENSSIVTPQVHGNVSGEVDV